MTAETACLTFMTVIALSFCGFVVSGVAAYLEITNGGRDDE